jgi:hypothetical protein
MFKILGEVNLTKLGPLVNEIDTICPSASIVFGSLNDRRTPAGVEKAIDELEKTAFVF